MLKSFGLQVRRAEMSHQQFMAHWLNVHAPMSRGIEGVRGYVLNEILDVATDENVEPLTIGMPIDGIAQLWFDSREAMMALTQTPEVKRWFSDGPNYIGARTGFAATERVIRAPSVQAPFKLMIFHGKKRDISVDEFRRRWREEYAALIAKLPGTAGYVQSEINAANPATNMPNVPVDEVDGIGELWATSAAQARHLIGAMAAATRAISAALFGKAIVLVAQETVIIAPPR